MLLEHSSNRINGDCALSDIPLPHKALARILSVAAIVTLLCLNITVALSAIPRLSDYSVGLLHYLDLLHYANFGALVSFMTSVVLIWRLRSSERSWRKTLLEHLQIKDESLKRIQSSQELFVSTINAMQEGLLLKTALGVIEFCNPAAERILGMPSSEIIGRTTLDPELICVKEDLSEFPKSEYPSYLTMMDGQPRTGCLMGYYRAGSGLHWVEVSSTAINKAPQANASAYTPCSSGVVVTFSDITDRRLVVEEATRLAAIVEHSHDAVLGTDLTGKLISWNAAAERLYGYSQTEVIGKNVAVLAPLEEQDFASTIIAAIMRGDTRDGIEVVRYRSDGTRIDLSLTFSPIRDQRGVLTGIACIGRDITESKAADARIRVSEARLAEAQQVAKLGSYELDLLTEEIVWSDEVFRLYEFDPSKGYPTYQEFLSRYPFEDQVRRKKLLDRSIETGEIFEIDTRITLPSGRLRYIQLKAKPVRNEKNETVRMVGTVMDITDRVLSEERFSVLFEHSSEPHLLSDSNGIIDCNPAMLDILRCENKSEIVGLHPADLSPEFQSDGRKSYEKSIEMDNLARVKGLHKFDWTHRRLDGEEFVVEVSLTHVTLHDRPALLCCWHDLTERLEAQKRIEEFNVALQFQMQELSQANERLAALSTTDGLTELANHRMFQERLAEEFSRAKRYGKTLSLLFIDVDYFKQYNDAYGHPAGDIVLKQVAGTIKSLARASDLPARYGGEEFTVIMPETAGTDAESLANRLRKEVEELTWPERQITVSIGIATLGQAMTDPAELIQESDRALYAAKKAGRNRVSSSDSKR